MATHRFLDDLAVVDQVIEIAQGRPATVRRAMANRVWMLISQIVAEIDDLDTDGRCITQITSIRRQLAETREIVARHAMRDQAPAERATVWRDLRAAAKTAREAAEILDSQG